VKRLKASRPGALLLDGGDNWQGSGTALWTKAQDMVDASKLSAWT
jgi:sulfur-oxidizing protein SoxB